MNSKLAIALFTCIIIANSSAFAMYADDIDTDGIHGQASPSSRPAVSDDLIKRQESPDFEFVLQKALEREVLEQMRLEEKILYTVSSE